MARRTVGSFWFLLSLLLIGCARNGSDGPPGKQTVITISRETTFVTGPLTKAGFVDYFAAANRLSSKGVTSKNNAAVLYFRALGPVFDGEEIPDEAFRMLRIPKPSKDGTYFVNLETFVTQQRREQDSKASAFSVTERRELLDRVGAGPWKKDDFPRVAAWLAANEGPLKLVLEGTRREKYFWPTLHSVDCDDDGSGNFVSARLLDAAALRPMGRALVCRAMLATGEGRFDDAWRDLLASHRLGRHAAKAITFSGVLAGLAIDGFACNADQRLFFHSRPGLEKARRYQRDLSALDPLPNIAHAFNIGERFMFLDSVAGLVQGRTGLREDLDLTENRSVEWDEILRIGNHWFNREYAALCEPDRWKRARRWAILSQEFEEFMEGSGGSFATGTTMAFGSRKARARIFARVLLAILFPACGAVKSAEERGIQTMRNTRVALALAAYRAENGQYPEQLGELTPLYLDSIPEDIFSGKPLKYSTTRDGYLLYSIGTNGKDDQGRWQGDGPSGDDDERVCVPPRSPDDKRGM